jgi:hypothetical protein
VLRLAPKCVRAAVHESFVNGVRQILAVFFPTFRAHSEDSAAWGWVLGVAARDHRTDPGLDSTPLSVQGCMDEITSPSAPWLAYRRTDRRTPERGDLFRLPDRFVPRLIKSCRQQLHTRT